MTLYISDEDVLIHAMRYYPIKRVPEFWDWILEINLAGNAQIKTPIETYENMLHYVPKDEDIKEDDLSIWLKEHKDAILLDEAVNPTLVERVLTDGYDLPPHNRTDKEIEKVNRDPYLIAYALNQSSLISSLAERCVVTNEHPSTDPQQPRQRANKPIPDVCKIMGVRCINIFGLIEEQDFKTKGARE